MRIKREVQMSGYGWRMAVSFSRGWGRNRKRWCVTVPIRMHQKKRVDQLGYDGLPLKTRIRIMKRAMVIFTAKRPRKFRSFGKEFRFKYIAKNCNAMRGAQ